MKCRWPLLTFSQASVKRVFASLCLAASVTLNILAAQAVPSKHHVPDGFVIEKVAGEPAIKFPMFAAFDERGRLFVSESSGLDLYKEITAGTRKCQVRLLEDRDADGRFETSRVFADKLVFPMGLVWRDGALYLADPPDLIALEDTDHDGRADKRTVVLTGFGHKDNGSLHGLIFGPDGWLYMTMGEPDGYRFTRPDGSVLEGNSGALIRCRADGSNVEVLCRGFENLVEVVFTLGGEIIGTDNWYQHPVGGIRDALLHLVEGGLYPMYPDNGSPKPVTGEPLPPLSLFPAVALSGLVLYRGSSFPPEMHGNLFSAQHNTRKVGRHVLRREGSTFRTEDGDFVTSDDPDFHPSDVLEDADGSVLVLDTGSWYTQHCPTGRIRNSPATGGIYRVRRIGAATIKDPWGLRVRWPAVSTKELVALLSDSRPAVRDRAQRTLSARGKAVVPTLGSLLSQSTDLTTKLHALWALAGISDQASVPILRRALESESAEMAATAAHVLALRKDREVAPTLCRIVNGESRTGLRSVSTNPNASKPSNGASAFVSGRMSDLPLRLAAAAALAHCGDTNSLPSLWRELSGETDRFFEHALIHAAHWIATERELSSALGNSHSRVQKAALLLLDQPPRSPSALKPEMVLERIAASDAELRQAALKILQKRASWANHAVALSRDWLAKPKLNEEEKLGLRGLMAAFRSDSAMQEAIGSALSDASSAIRLFLLETLAQTGVASPSISKGIARSVRADERPAIRLQAVRAAAALRMPGLEQVLSQLAESPDEPLDLRLEALRATVGRTPKVTAAAFDFLLNCLASTNDPITRLAAAEVLRRSHLNDAQLLGALKAIRGQSLISPSPLLSAFRETTGSAMELVDYFGELAREGWRPGEDEFTKIIERFPDDARQKAKSLFASLQQDAEGQRAKLFRFEPLLNGGDAERGRTVFFGNKVACATCHAIGQTGGRIGPDLTKVGTIRSGRDILESILLPSSTFAQGYESYLITTGDGSALSGVLAEQSADAVVLRDASGAQWPLRRKEIREMRQQAVSIMPEGLETGLTEEELRDLLAFLQSLK